MDKVKPCREADIIVIMMLMINMSLYEIKMFCIPIGMYNPRPHVCIYHQYSGQDDSWYMYTETMVSWILIYIIYELFTLICITGIAYNCI